MLRKYFSGKIHTVVIDLFNKFSDSRIGKRWENLELVIKAGIKELEKKK